MTLSCIKKLLLQVFFLLICNYTWSQNQIVTVQQTYVFAISGTVADLNARVIGLLPGDPAIWMNAPTGGTAFLATDPLVSGQKYYLKNTEDKTKYRIGTRLRIIVFQISPNLVPSKANIVCAGETVDIKAEGLLTNEEFSAKNTNGLGLNLIKVTNYLQSTYFIKADDALTIPTPKSMSWTAADDLISNIPGASMYIINGGVIAGPQPPEELAVLSGLDALGYLNKQGPPKVPSGYAFWLGLKQYGNANDYDDRTTVNNKGWYWVDGTPLGYQNWDKQANGTLIEPNDYNANGVSGAVPPHDEDNAEFNFQSRIAAAWVDAPDLSPSHASVPLFEFQGTTSFQWSKYNTISSTWVPIVGANMGVLSVTAIVGTEKYKLDYVINGIAQTPLSYDVIGADLKITSQPTDSSICGGNTSFSVVSDGDVFQWQVSTDGLTWNNVVNNAIYSDATTSILKITAATAAMNGYKYRVNIKKTGTTCDKLSNEVSLIVTTVATPTISAGSATTFCAGGSVVLSSSSATGNTWSNGATTQAITVSTAGTYTVAVTSGSCTSATSAGTIVSVTPIPATPTISAASSATFCAGGSVVLNSSSATGNLWSTGETTPSITVTTAGNYTVTVTTNGCTSASSAATTVTVSPIPATPTISAGGPTTFCAGGNVVLTASVSNGYLWSTGETTQSITVSTSGNYTVAAISAGCSSASSAATAVSVTPIPVTPTISAGGLTTFCTGGSVVLTSSPATSYLWSTGETSQSITVISSGNYTVTVTNGACTSASSAATTVSVSAAPATPTISASGATTFCAGGNVVLTSSLATSYLWSNGETTRSITVSTAGTYTVSIINGGCASTPSAGTTVSLTPLPTTPTISAGSATTFCAGGSVVLTSSAAASYLWSTGETTQSITVTSSGTYTLTVAGGGCTSASSAGTTVSVNPIPATPTITSSSSTTFCAGGSVVLNSSSATGNLWSTGETSSSITVSTAGNYTVKVTTNGCTSASSAATTVNVTPLPVTPTISAGSSTTFCAGGSVVLTSSVASAYIWSTGETTRSITVSSSGTFTVAVTNGACTSASSVATIVSVTPIPSTPVITSSSSTTFCTGGSVVLNSSSSTGNLWSTGETTPSITVSTAGNYTVKVTNNGCTSASSAITTVTVNPVPATPTVSAGASTTFCAGGNVVLTSSLATSYLWSTGETSRSISVSTNGTYTVAVSNGGCTSANSAGTTVTVVPLPVTPTISAGRSTTFCTGGSVVLTSSLAASYLWSTGETTRSITVSSSGTYTVTVTISGCASAPSAATTVSVIPIPPTPTISAASATSFCEGDSVTLSSSSSTGNLWSTGETTPSIVVKNTGNYTVMVTINGCSSATSAVTAVSANPFPKINTNADGSDNIEVCTSNTSFSNQLDASIQDGTPTTDYTYVWSKDGVVIAGETNSTLDVNSIGKYSVEVTSIATNCSSTRVIEVVSSEAPQIVSVDVVDLSDVNSIIVTISGRGNYEYSVDGVNGTFQTGGFFNNVSSGKHEVFVRDVYGCGFDSKIVYVIGVPKFFTPNNDSFNDYWNIKGLDTNNQKSIIYIYNRYGKLLKQISPIGTGWDGTFNDIALPTDDYWYSIKLEDGRDIKGHFSLKR